MDDSSPALIRDKRPPVPLDEDTPVYLRKRRRSGRLTRCDPHRARVALRLDGETLVVSACRPGDDGALILGAERRLAAGDRLRVCGERVSFGRLGGTDEAERTMIIDRPAALGAGSVGRGKTLLIDRVACIRRRRRTPLVLLGVVGLAWIAAALFALRGAPEPSRVHLRATVGEPRMIQFPVALLGPAAEVVNWGTHSCKAHVAHVDERMVWVQLRPVWPGRTRVRVRGHSGSAVVAVTVTARREPPAVDEARGLRAAEGLQREGEAAMRRVAADRLAVATGYRRFDAAVRMLERVPFGIYRPSYPVLVAKRKRAGELLDSTRSTLRGELDSACPESEPARVAALVRSLLALSRGPHDAHVQGERPRLESMLRIASRSGGVR